jgi:uncharacterized lipoprotein YehR (DUF1307 family)
MSHCPWCRWLRGVFALWLSVLLSGCTKEQLHRRGYELDGTKMKRVFRFY